MKNSEPRKIAAFASTQIGDTLMATSLYRALRIQYPNAELTLLSQVAQHPVLSGFNTFDRTVLYQPDLDLDALYDLVVQPVFCGDAEVNANFDRFQNVISLDRLHGELRRSWRNKWNGTFTHLLFYKHQFELNADLAGAFGYAGHMPDVYCPQGDPAQYGHLKGRIGLFINTPQNKFQALPNRQWPLTHWQDLIELLSPGNVVLVGAESDLPNLQRLAAMSGAPFEATATLRDFSAVCRNLKALVTTDGGGMHAAATTGVPIVSLHGTSSPILLHPWIYPEGKCIAVASPNACSPCQRSYRLKACESGLTQMDCMQNIRAEFVERAVIEVNKLKAGTCFIMKGEQLMTKAAYLRDWKRALAFTLNHDWARIAVRITPNGQAKPSASEKQGLRTVERETDLMHQSGPHIFFSPHADDVVLSCGGTIHSLISQNKLVEVIGVFAGIPKTSRQSAYARHLHAKWRLPDPFAERWHEGTEAMSELGITAFEHWDYPEAPYRTAHDGCPLYTSDEEMTGDVLLDDQPLRDRIAQRVRTHLKKLPDTALLYFPLSLGLHVDHRILFDIGLELCASGKRVRFYEDYPYAEKYQVNGSGDQWRAEVVSVAIEPKFRAACTYASQLWGMGGSPSALDRRLRVFGAEVGGGDISERYWGIDANIAEEFLKNGSQSAHPLARKNIAPKLRDFGKFLKTFKWHDLNEVLPVGQGFCLDVGCGPARHRSLVEERGYTWLGIDRNTFAAETLCSDAVALPVLPKSMAAVVAGQVLEYVEQPEAVVAEAARVLESGGIFCGSVSFLEPVHGRTYFNLSPLILERLLVRHGFADIEIKPGLNGFALMLWTWLRRTGIPFADSFAIPLMFVMLAPLAAIIFTISWLRWRCGIGSNHQMRWLTQTAPLEFAGHVLFVARKKART